MAGIRLSNSGPSTGSSPIIKDTTLLKILQVDSSRTTDINGEPMPVFHGTKQQFETFRTSNDWGYGGAYFNTNRNVADIETQFL